MWGKGGRPAVRRGPWWERAWARRDGRKTRGPGDGETWARVQASSQGRGSGGKKEGISHCQPFLQGDSGGRVRPARGEVTSCAERTGRLVGRTGPRERCWERLWETGRTGGLVAPHDVIPLLDNASPFPFKFTK